VTRFFIDTEFIERGGDHPIELISIGVATETLSTPSGQPSATGYFYAISSEFNPDHASRWVRQNVLPNVLSANAQTMRRGEIALSLLHFVQRYPQPWEFWAYFADYDWVVLCQLYGAMIDLPDGFPYFCLDMKQEMVRLGVPRDALPLNNNEHDALADAVWLRDCWEKMQASVRSELRWETLA
jgi:hypothetical protein